MVCSCSALCVSTIPCEGHIMFKKEIICFQEKCPKMPKAHLEKFQENDTSYDPILK